MPQLVYCKISLELINNLPDFFRKLKAFIGVFRIEQQTVWDIDKYMTISFHTDDVSFIEGEDKEVLLQAENTNEGWQFTTIIKLRS